MFVVASSQLPCKRSRISGFPFSHRTFARSVAVDPPPRPVVRGVQIRFAPVSPRPLARTCKQGLPPMPPPGSHVDCSWLPCTLQPERPELKPVLAITFAPPCGITCTSSTRHSPGPSRKSCSVSAGPCPLSRTPVHSTVVQLLFALSSLSAHEGASRGSARGSTRSRLLPPPSDHNPHRPPVP